MTKKTCKACGKKFESDHSDSCHECISKARDWGICPNCGSENLEDLIDHMYGNEIGAGIECKDCGWRWWC